MQNIENAPSNVQLDRKKSDARVVSQKSRADERTEASLHGRHQRRGFLTTVESRVVAVVVESRTVV